MSEILHNMPSYNYCDVIYSNCKTTGELDYINAAGMSRALGYKTLGDKYENIVNSK